MSGYNKELRDQIEQNLRMFDYPSFDSDDIFCVLGEIDHLNAKIAELEEIGQENERAIINAATLFSQAGIGDPDGTLIGIVKNTVKRITELEQEVEYLARKKQTIFDLCKGTIERLRSRITELETENARLREELSELQKWYDEMTNSEIRGEL